jgi:hypothetical protein
LLQVQTQLVCQGPPPQLAPPPGQPAEAGPDLAPRRTRQRRIPFWDAENKKLYLLGARRRLLVAFGKEAPNLTELLDAFQAAGWPRSLADPLPLENGEDRAAYLERRKAVLRRLNEKMPADGIRFEADGTGRGVCWGFQPRRA